MGVGQLAHVLHRGFEVIFPQFVLVSDGARIVAGVVSVGSVAYDPDGKVGITVPGVQNVEEAFRTVAFFVAHHGEQLDLAGIHILVQQVKGHHVVNVIAHVGVENDELRRVFLCVKRDASGQ